VASLKWEARRILIWGKTYPELSSKYFETVCTGGVFEDTGSPVRLYPIPYRRLEGNGRFSKYQWIKAVVAPNPKDTRPESYRIDANSIALEEPVPTTKDEWALRASVLFKDPAWQFGSVDDLITAQNARRTSLGVVFPRTVTGVEVVARPPEDQLSFEEKINRLTEQIEIDKRQLTLFAESVPAEMRDLEFLSHRIRINWLCLNPNCQGHKMQVLDWEVAELHRREGDRKALDKVKEICDLSKYATRFFLGNMLLHPTSFTIVGIWYPKKVPGLLFR